MFDFAAPGAAPGKTATAPGRIEEPRFALLLQGLNPISAEAAPAPIEGSEGAVRGEDAAELLLETVDQSLIAISRRIPQNSGLSPAGWSRVEQALVAAVKDGFARVGIAMPDGLISAIQARIEAGPALFAALQTDVRALIARGLTSLPETASPSLSALRTAPGQSAVEVPPDLVAATPVGIDNAAVGGKDTTTRHPIKAPFLSPDAPWARVARAAPRAEGAVLAQGTIWAAATKLSEASAAVPKLGTSVPQSLRVETPQPIAPLAQVPQLISALPDAETVHIVRTDPASAAQADLAPSILGQIRSAKVSEGRMRIELSPASLGALEIDVTSDEAGQLRVVIRAESPATLAALRGDRQGLVDMLSGHGFDFDQSHLDFEGFKRGNDRAPSEPGAALVALEATAGEADLPLPREGETSLYRPIATGRLDILT